MRGLRAARAAVHDVPVLASLHKPALSCDPSVTVATVPIL